MSKHTPGPWTLSGPMGTGHLHGREPEFRVYAHRTLFLEVCADPDGYAQGENEANARLIAAAPELLEVVQKFVAWSEAERDPSGTTFWQRVEMCREVEALASAAIAKATGEPA